MLLTLLFLCVDALRTPHLTVRRAEPDDEEAEILRDAPVTDAAWDNGSNFARRCYMGDGPGAASEAPTSGLPAELEGVEPTDEQLVLARDNFAVLLITLRELDWLYLAHTGHVRAQFARGEGGEWQGGWVAP